MGLAAVLRARPACAGLLLACSCTVLAQGSDELRALLDRGQSAQVYALGKSHPERLGEPDFDFYYGVAAIDAGHPGEGVLALERYLAYQPDNTAARLQIGRGYFELGEDDRATETFQALQREPLAPVVAATVERFLQALATRRTRYAPSYGGYVELGAGRDSNVNAAPTAATVSVPVLGIQPLLASSQKTADSFTSLGGAAYGNWPLRPGVSLFANGQGERRFNATGEDHGFDVGNYGLNAGVAWTRGAEVVRAAVNFSAVTLGAGTYQHSWGTTLDWQHAFSERQSVTVSGQAARLGYFTTTTTSDSVTSVVDNSPRDADFLGLAVVLRRSLELPWAPVLSAGASIGEQRTRVDHPELVPRTRGLNVGMDLVPAPRWQVQAGYSFQQSDYGGPDFFADPDARHDRYDALNLAGAYQLTPRLSLRAEGLWAHNASNADAYAFPRAMAVFKLRYELK